MTPICWPLETASAGPSVSTGNRPRRVSDGRGSRQPRSIALMSRAGLLPTAVSDLPAGIDNRALVIALALVLGSPEARLCGVSESVRCSTD
jgi:hypothetical protein